MVLVISVVVQMLQRIVADIHRTKDVAAAAGVVDMVDVANSAGEEYVRTSEVVYRVDIVVVDIVVVVVGSMDVAMRDQDIVVVAVVWNRDCAVVVIYCCCCCGAKMMKLRILMSDCCCYYFSLNLVVMVKIRQYRRIVVASLLLWLDSMRLSLPFYHLPFPLV